MTFETIPTGRVVADPRRALNRVALLGIERTQTWFSNYLTVLDGASEGRRTPTFGTAEERDEARRHWEPVGQAVQLATAAQAWPGLDQDQLRQNLRLVVKGSALPPVGSSDDKSQNMLLELTTVALLQRQGLKIEITPDREDVRVSLPGYGKRPAHANSHERNLRKVRQQFVGCLSDCVRGGIAAIGIERVEGASADFLVAKDEAHPRRIRDQTSTKVTKQMRMYGGDERPFWPIIPVKTEIFCGAVLLLAPAVLVVISRISIFCTAEDSEKLSAVELAFAAMMPTSYLQPGVAR